MTLIHPTVHMNGTSRASLLEGYITAIQAVEAAIDAVQKTNPNGRDYYVQEAGAFAQAQDQHQKRLLALNGVVLELTKLAERLV
jgi:Asp-tRNA(Asn)/Glu-tRNA(Gln) amidotransferase A subunit family amidase